MNKVIKVWCIGEMKYLPALKLQQHLASLHFNNGNNQDTLLLLEHPPVYTTGLRTKEYTEEEAAKLRKTGTECCTRVCKQTETNIYRSRIPPVEQRRINNFSWTRPVGCVSYNKFKKLQNQHALVCLPY